MTPNTPIETVAQPTDGKEKLQPIVTADTAARLRFAAVTWRMSQGEVIDKLAQAHLPAAPTVAAPGQE